MDELELKHLAPYLPYGLSFSVNLNDVRDNFPDELRTLKLAETNIDLALKIGKPILRHLSSMTKEEAYDLLCLIIGIEDVGFEQSDLDYISLNYEYSILEIKGGFPFYDYVSGIKYTINISDDGIACVDTGSNGMYIPHSAYDYLFSNHFDVFGLIEKGLAIEKNINTK